MTSRYVGLVREAKIYLDAEQPLPFTLGRELILALHNAGTAHQCDKDVLLPFADPVIASLYGTPTL